jgi:hypothetical protein
MRRRNRNLLERPLLAIAVAIILLIAVGPISGKHSAQTGFAGLPSGKIWPCLNRKDLLRDKDGHPVWLSSSELMMAVIEKHPIERPSALGKNNLHGVVTIQMLIDKTGKVVCARGVKGHPVGMAAAIQSLRKWSFKPYSVNGKRKSVAAVLDLPFDFS